MTNGVLEEEVDELQVDPELRFALGDVDDEDEPLDVETRLTGC